MSHSNILGVLVFNCLYSENMCAAINVKITKCNRLFGNNGCRIHILFTDFASLLLPVRIYGNIRPLQWSLSDTLAASQRGSNLFHYKGMLNGLFRPQFAALTRGKRELEDPV